MGIFGFLVVLCCLILIAWGFRVFSRLLSSQKHQLRSRPPRHPPPKVLEFQERDTTILKPTPPASQIQNKTISVTDRRATRPPSSKHQQNIRRGDLVLQQLRSKAIEAKLPIVIATLRKLDPYAFEELLLTCCKEQGWQIQRNCRYSGDGGVDGRVAIGGKVYAIQAKRYMGYIKPQHIRDFHKVIQKEGSAGGFFFHTGKTGTLSKQLLRESYITLISGQRLVDFVLGRQLKILGITIARPIKRH